VPRKIQKRDFEEGMGGHVDPEIPFLNFLGGMDRVRRGQANPSGERAEHEQPAAHVVA
jgi:hypothetical protein